MGLFSKKTDAEIIAEARALYIEGDLTGADLKLIKLAQKGNPDACYWSARIQLEIAEKKKPELYMKAAKINLEKAVAAGAIQLKLSIPEVVTDIRMLVIGNAFEWALRNGNIDFEKNIKRSISHYLDGVLN